MLLMDHVVQTARMLREGKSGLDPVVAGYTDLAERLQGTPRYLFDAAAVHATLELGLGRPKVLLEALRHVRAPLPRMWIEWDDADRAPLRARLGDRPQFPDLQPLPGRLGFLLETDPSGRRGRATWAWTTKRENKVVDVPNIGAIEPYFDLDGHFPLPADKEAALLRGGLARQWGDNPVQRQALLDIWSTADHHASPWGQNFFDLTGQNRMMQQLAYSDVAGEYLGMWACIILLTASRKTVDYVRVDQSKLNKARAKQKKTPLLDHTRVVMHLTPQEHRPVVRGALGYTRKSPRVHLVSRYLATRGEKFWIVEPYVRGSGDTVTRHVHVRG